MSVLVLFIYRLILVPFALLSLPILALFNGKIRRGLALRLKKPNWPEFHERPLWIHASSGEFEYAKAVIREIKARAPRLPIVVTYFSPTFAKNVERFPGVDFATPLPLDLPGPVVTFLKRVNPRELLLARTDFWPEILTQTRRRKIPIRVFAYTQKPTTSRLRRLIARWRLSLADHIDCVSRDDQANLAKIGLGRASDRRPSVSVQGDTRYDQVRYRLDHPKVLPEALRPKQTCLVAGSTWPEDEAVLLPALHPVLRENDESSSTGSRARLQLVLVPHEPTPEHIQSLQKQLERMGLAYALYSQGEDWSDKAVLLVDQVGVLAELYLWGDFAFVGGSFRKTVHSVMEALGAGCLTFVGPLHANNREALEFQELTLAGRPGIEVVNSADEWTTKIEAALAHPEELKKFREALEAEFNRRLGAAPRLAEATLRNEFARA